MVCDGGSLPLETYSETDSGFCKSCKYMPGMRFSKIPLMSSWNGVYVDGQWGLVNCQWGARYIESSAQGPKVKEIPTDFYCFPEPGLYRMQFLPRDSFWQLTKPDLSLAQFEEIPFVSALFFELGAQFPPDTKCVQIPDDNGLIHLDLLLSPQKVMIEGVLSCSREIHKTPVSLRDEIFLSRYIFQTVTDKFSFTICPPYIEKPIYFHILAAPQSNTVPEFREISIFLLSPRSQSNRTNKNSLEPMPLTIHPGREWGLSQYSHNLGITASISEASYNVSMQKIFHLHLKIQSDIIQVSNSNVFALLHNNYTNSHILDQFVYLSVTQSRCCVEILSLPFPGKYSLQIILLSNELNILGKYLLNYYPIENDSLCLNGTLNLLSIIRKGKPKKLAGISKYGKTLNIRLADGGSFFQNFDECTSRFETEILHNKDVTLAFRLIFMDNDMSDDVVMTTCNDFASLSFDAPFRGDYFLYIFGSTDIKYFKTACLFHIFKD